MSRTWKDTKAWYDRMSEMLHGIQFTWGGPGWARFCKRQLSKSRRRSWQDERHTGGWLHWERECNWKGH